MRTWLRLRGCSIFVRSCKQTSFTFRSHEEQGFMMTRSRRYTIYFIPSAGRVRIALEISGLGISLDPRMITVMQDLNLIHCVDLSQTEPAYKSDILYTRLFGPTGNNVYQFSDEELREIDTKASRASLKSRSSPFMG